MISRRVAGLVLTASAVGGIGLGVGVDALTADPHPPRSAMKSILTTIPTPRATAVKQPTVEVKDPILVTNHDGSATLSATLVNHTDRALDLNEAAAGDEDEINRPILLVYGLRAQTPLQPGSSTSIGGVDDAYRIRFRDPVDQEKMRFSLTFLDSIKGGPTITFTARVVTRSAAHGGVADNGPNPAIQVHEPKIVVIPGQERAYVAGWITSTLEDYAYDIPTAIDSSGGRIAYRHQTATGGPYGVAAVPGKKSFLGYPPYLQQDQQGDADYFLAKDVTVGETIMVTMRFPSGDVVAPFTVVQGNADGTI